MIGTGLGDKCGQKEETLQDDSGFLPWGPGRAGELFLARKPQAEKQVVGEDKPTYGRVVSQVPWNIPKPGATVRYPYSYPNLQWLPSDDKRFLASMPGSTRTSPYLPAQSSQRGGSTASNSHISRLAQGFYGQQDVSLLPRMQRIH